MVEYCRKSTSVRSSTIIQSAKNAADYHGYKDQRSNLTNHVEQTTYAGELSSTIHVQRIFWRMKEQIFVLFCLHASLPARAASIRELTLHEGIPEGSV